MLLKNRVGSAASKVVKSSSVKSKKIGSKAPPPVAKAVKGAIVKAAAKAVAAQKNKLQNNGNNKGSKIILQDPQLVKAGKGNQNQPAKAKKDRNGAITQSIRPNSGNSNAKPAKLANGTKKPKPVPQANPGSEFSIALNTARAISTNRSHPKQGEVLELIRTYEKGWVDEKKFVSVLRTLAF